MQVLDVENVSRRLTLCRRGWGVVRKPPREQVPLTKKKEQSNGSNPSSCIRLPAGPQRAGHFSGSLPPSEPWMNVGEGVEFWPTLDETDSRKQPRCHNRRSSRIASCARA